MRSSVRRSQKKAKARRKLDDSNKTYSDVVCRDPNGQKQLDYLKPRCSAMFVFFLYVRLNKATG